MIILESNRPVAKDFYSILFNHNRVYKKEATLRICCFKFQNFEHRIAPMKN